MAKFFAKIVTVTDPFDQNQTVKMVENVIKTGNDCDENWCTNLYGGFWKETSRDGSFRGKAATVGDYYNETIDKFSKPQEFASWTFNSVTNEWEAPIARPTILSYETIAVENPETPYLTAQPGDVLTNYYYLHWDEDNQKWTTVNKAEKQNLEWNPITLSWDVVSTYE